MFDLNVLTSELGKLLDELVLESSELRILESNIRQLHLALLNQQRRASEEAWAKFCASGNSASSGGS